MKGVGEERLMKQGEEAKKKKASTQLPCEDTREVYFWKHKLWASLFLIPVTETKNKHLLLRRVPLCLPPYLWGIFRAAVLLSPHCE